MEKKHIITIAGKPGSGKSSTSKSLAASLGYKHFSSGDLFRAIGKERGIDVFAANVAAETEKEIDYQVDAKLRELGEYENEMVIDSRTAWHWMPQSFKVYLDLDLEIAAKRILANMDPERLKVEDIPEKPSEYAERLQARLDSETKRYMNLYQINPYDMSNYDLVVDTAKLDLEAVIETVTYTYKNWLL
jgi:cytidylate kinase